MFQAVRAPEQPRVHWRGGREEGWVIALRFAGELIVSASLDGELWWFDRNGRPVGEFQLGKRLNDMAVSGDVIACAQREGGIAFVSLSTGDLLRTSDCPAATSIVSVGRDFLSTDTHVRLWRDGKEAAVFESPGLPRSISVSPNEQHAAWIINQAQVMVWDLQSLTPARDPIETTIMANRLAFRDDHTVVVACAELAYCDLPTGAVRVEYERAVRARALHNAGGSTLVGVAGQALFLPGQGSAVIPATYQTYTYQPGDLTAVVADASHVVCGNDCGEIVILTRDSIVGEHADHSEIVYDAVIHGNKAVTSGCDGTARVWDLDSGELLRVLKHDDPRVWGLTFLHDGAQLLTFSDTRSPKLRIWDLQTGRELRSFTCPDIQAFTLLSDDMLLLATDDALQLWDLQTCVLTATTPLSRTVTRMQLTQGQLLVCTKEGIELWRDLTFVKQLAPPAEHFHLRDGTLICVGHNMLSTHSANERTAVTIDTHSLRDVSFMDDSFFMVSRGKLERFDYDGRLLESVKSGCSAGAMCGERAISGDFEGGVTIWKRA